MNNEYFCFTITILLFSSDGRISKMLYLMNLYTIIAHMNVI